MGTRKVMKSIFLAVSLAIAAPWLQSCSLFTFLDFEQVSSPPAGASTDTQNAELSLSTLISKRSPVTVGQRTYHIGNSLTDSINDWLEPIARSAGYDHVYLRSTIPGAPTDWNWNHPGEALGEADYRVVFNTKAPIDHLSTQPFAGHDRSLENETEYSGRFYRLARQKSPNVQFWIYAQWSDLKLDDRWAKADGSAKELGLKPARNWEEAAMNHLAYHEALRQRLDDQNDGKPVLIVPGGLGLVNLKRAIEAGKVPGIKNFFAEHFNDDSHLTAKGSYMVALIFYSSIYAKSPVGVTFANSGLTAEQAKIYQQVAWDTVQNYPWTGVKSHP